METNRQKAVRIFGTGLDLRKDLAEPSTYEEAHDLADDAEHRGAFYLDLIAVDNSLGDAWIRAKDESASTEEIERKFVGEVATVFERMAARADYPR